jgi:chaperonin GroES
LSEQETGMRTGVMVTMEAPKPRTFFTNLEEALAIDKLKSARREARAFMPIRDQVLVYVVEKEEMTDAGTLYLPETAQERQSEGVVIAAGRGRMDASNIFVATEVEVGDRVLFGRYAGTEITLRGKVCRLMREDELLGVIR